MSGKTLRTLLLISAWCRPQIVEFLRKQEDFVDLMIKHIGTSAIMDLLLRMLTCIEPQQLRQDVLCVSRWDKSHFNLAVNVDQKSPQCVLLSCLSTLLIFGAALTSSPLFFFLVAKRGESDSEAGGHGTTFSR